MSTSTNAMLVYGYIWDDEFDLFGGDEDEGDEERDDSGEWEEIVAARRGIHNPWSDFPDLERLPYAEQTRLGDEWAEAHKTEIDAWNDGKNAIAADYGVEIDSHCSGDCSMPIVMIAGAGFSAQRGFPQTVTAADLAVNPEWDAKLQRFVTDLGIDISEAKGPAWFLASYWG